MLWLVLSKQAVYLDFKFDRDWLLFGLEDEQVWCALEVAHLAPFFRFVCFIGEGRCIICANCGFVSVFLCLYFSSECDLSLCIFSPHVPFQGPPPVPSAWTVIAVGWFSRSQETHLECISNSGCFLFIFYLKFLR